MPAKIQCTLAPKDYTRAHTFLLGNISDRKTQITAPCPMACEAIKNNRKDIRKGSGLCLKYIGNQRANDVSQGADNY